MADNGENSEVKDPPSVSPSYLEVNCISSSKIRRFSVGTEAGSALNLINRKIDDGLPLALYIEAVKEGEEPISFGPNSILISHGHGWKLQTVTEPEGARARASVGRRDKFESSPPGLDDLHSTKGLLPSVIGVGYIAKVVLAFVLLFVLGAIFTLALENLPRLLIFINSSIFVLQNLPFQMEKNVDPEPHTQPIHIHAPAEQEHVLHTSSTSGRRIGRLSLITQDEHLNFSTAYLHKVVRPYMGLVCEDALLGAPFYFPIEAEPKLVLER